MSIGMEHSGEYTHRSPTETISDMIGDTDIVRKTGPKSNKIKQM
jgi:hypothetical protein